MELITRPLASSSSEFSHLSRVSIVVERQDLAKRRWRGVAGDGHEFGFDLEEPLHHGAVFFVSDASYYVVVQQLEPVLEVALSDPAHSARLGWMIGNLHFPIHVEHGFVRVADDAAIRQLFQREHVHFHEKKALFQPLKAVAHAH